MDNLCCDSDDKMLFEFISRGNETAFKFLFERYKTRTYGVAYKWTKSAVAAEEITQEVFISIWISKSQLAIIKEPTPYIYTIIYNKIKHYLKKEFNQSRILQLPIFASSKISNDTQESIQAKESQQIINQALCKLTPQKKQIFILSRQHGHTYSEIAELMNLSPHTVKSHLLQTVKFVRTYMQDITIFIAGMSALLFF